MRISIQFELSSIGEKRDTGKLFPPKIHLGPTILGLPPVGRHRT